MKNSIACLCLLLCSFWGYSQISAAQYDTPAVIPQSPEVSSLLRYSEVPVSYYNGIPNVGVPIYTLQGRELSAPINLSYHAGGHRVSEESSWVGLGWNLSTGGQISRTVKGYADDRGSKGFISTPYTVSYLKGVCDQSITTLIDGYDCNDLTGQVGQTNNFDYEPDDFNYSMLGQSGRFMFNQDRSNNPKGEIIQFPNKNVKIVPIYSGYKIIEWNITDTNGIVYHFEIGNIFDNSESYQSIGDGAIEFSVDGGQGVDYVETWDLVSVTSPNGDVITFEYDHPILDGYTSAFPFNDISTTQGSQSLVTHEGGIELTDKKRINTYSIARRHYTLLSKITSAKGSVHFVRDTANRLDTQSNKQRLQYVEVYNNSNDLLQRIKLTHGYFNSTAAANSEFIATDLQGYIPAGQDSFLNKRLYLQKVTFEGHHDGYNSSDDYSYSFGYNTDTMLPHKRSYAQDHWGYYNGKTNANLIPYQSAGNTQKAIREVDPTFSEACILNQITYPEGGVTKLSFENNRGNIRNVDLPPYIEKKIKVKALASNPHSISENNGETTYVFWSNNFTVSSDAKPSTSDPTKVQLEYTGFSNRCDTVDALYTGENQVCETMFFDLYKVNGLTETLVERYSIWESGTLLLDMDIDYTYKVKIEITSTGDDYNLIDHYSEAEFTWFDQNPNQNAEVFDYFGGLRVKAIKTYDKQKLTAYKSFEYSDGYILSQPFYFSIGTGDVRKYVSQSWVPLLTTQSGYAGYKTVIENIHQVATETGYSTLDAGSSEVRQIRRTYSPASTDVAFPGAPYTQEWVGGHPILEEVTGKSSSTSSYEVYADQNIDNIEGFVMSREDHFFPFDLASQQAIIDCMENANCDITRNLYNIWPGQKLPSKQTVITKEGTRELTQTTETFFESVPNHHNPTRTKFTDSKGDVYETIIRYPYEENHASLLAENRLSTPLNTKQYKESTLMQTAEVQYGSFTGSDPATNPNNLLTQALFGAKKANALEERITYHDYTKYGQPREVSKTDGTHITYIWGYNYNYPVAKIENATYAQVSALVNEENIQNLTGTALDNALSVLRSSLPNAMVSTYIFEPLIGMTQSTDPRGRNTYYKYDTMGRLAYVLDHDQHVLSENNYHYKNN